MDIPSDILSALVGALATFISAVIYGLVKAYVKGENLVQRARKDLFDDVQEERTHWKEEAEGLQEDLNELTERVDQLELENQLMEKFILREYHIDEVPDHLPIDEDSV